MSRFRYVAFLVIILTLSGCADKKLAVISCGLRDGRYDSEFPSGNASDEIANITHSVKKLYSVSTYTTYQFKKEAGITSYRIHQGNYQKSAWGVVTTHETVFGTATLINYSGSGATLLTCAHILNSPDTLISYYETTEEDPLFYVKSFSVKEKQENWIKDFGPVGPFPVLASDPDNDIAFLGKKIENPTDSLFPFPYPAGRAADLEWGSFVYILGYPLGNLIITKGLASPLPDRTSGAFTIDALLNKGFSGGIILAIRDGVPNFELVGMVKTVSSTSEPYLRPETSDQKYAVYIPYQGNAFVATGEKLQYGLNSVVTMEAIRAFYSRNRGELVKNGFNLDEVFQISKP
jgi:hypothetical protein